MCPDARKKPLTWPRAIAIALFIFGAPALFRAQSLVQRPFNPKPLNLLERSHPQCVLLGDSMLGSRIDQATLDQISGLRSAVMAYSGSATAHWYLLLKNVIATQSQPPHSVVVFFRDKQLTMPAHRAGLRFRDGLEMCMRGKEPVYRAILQRAQRDTTSLAERFTNAVYLIQRKRTDWQTKVQRFALKLSVAQRERADVREFAGKIFDSENSRTDQQIRDARDGEASLDAAAHDFQSNVANSFLPPMLEIARAKHIRLVFYRVKHRPKSADSPSVDTPNLEQYANELRTYLAGHDAVLLDETTDPRVTLDFYGGDDHVRDEMMVAYTTLFSEKVGPHLDLPPAAVVPPAAE